MKSGYRVYIYTVHRISTNTLQEEQCLTRATAGASNAVDRDSLMYNQSVPSKVVVINRWSFIAGVTKSRFYCKVNFV